MNLTLQLVAFEQSKWSNLINVSGFCSVLGRLKENKGHSPTMREFHSWCSWLRLSWAPVLSNLQTLDLMTPMSRFLDESASCGCESVHDPPTPHPGSVSLESSTNTLGKQRKGWAVCWALNSGKGGPTPFKQLLKDPQPLIEMTRQYQQSKLMQWYKKF